MAKNTPLEKAHALWGEMRKTIPFLRERCEKTIPLMRQKLPKKCLLFTAHTYIGQYTSSTRVPTPLTLTLYFLPIHYPQNQSWPFDLNNRSRWQTPEHNMLISVTKLYTHVQWQTGHISYQANSPPPFSPPGLVCLGPQKRPGPSLPLLILASFLGNNSVPKPKLTLWPMWPWIVGQGHKQMT